MNSTFKVVALALATTLSGCILVAVKHLPADDADFRASSDLASCKMDLAIERATFEMKTAKARDAGAAD